MVIPQPGVQRCIYLHLHTQRATKRRCSLVSLSSASGGWQHTRSSGAQFLASMASFMAIVTLIANPLWYTVSSLKERAPTCKGIPSLRAWLAYHNAVLVPLLRAPTPRWQAAPKDWVPSARPTYPAEAVIGGQVAKTSSACGVAGRATGEGGP